MIDPKEKSTGLCPSSASAVIDGDLLLDGRFGLFHRTERWLAVADLHFGYEASRRRAGALWPMWGMETVADRLRALVNDWNPETLILVGDVVDSSAAPDEATAWIAGLYELCPQVILIEGNHDRGPIRREFDWVPSFCIGEFFFEHGHLDPCPNEVMTRVRGHLHPSIHLRDGAGTSLRLPSLVLEEQAETATREIILPAFSPWAGGGRYSTDPRATKVRQWACSPQRVFEVVE